MQNNGFRYCTQATWTLNRTTSRKWRHTQCPAPGWEEFPSDNVGRKKPQQSHTQHELKSWKFKEVMSWMCRAESKEKTTTDSALERCTVTQGLPSLQLSTGHWRQVQKLWPGTQGHTRTLKVGRQHGSPAHMQPRALTHQHQHYRHINASSPGQRKIIPDGNLNPHAKE